MNTVEKIMIEVRQLLKDNPANIEARIEAVLNKKIQPVKIPFKWEESKNFSRTKVIGGWLVHGSDFLSESMVFVPDPEHKWEIE